jgi:DNA polymerase-3 subunit gamma/tau
MQTMYRDGADPVAVLQDLLDVTYWITRIKVAPEVADAPYTPEAERTRGRELAGKLSMPVLTRTWQLLLKGLEETQRADAQLQAAEMVMVRLAYAADLPPPAELARELSSGGTPPAAQLPAPRPMRTGGSGTSAAPASAFAEPEPAMASPERAPAAAPLPAPGKSPQSYLDVIRLFEENREIGIRTQLYNSVHLVKFEPGRIELRPTEHAPRDLASKTMSFLTQWTGARWVVSISQEEGDPTLAEQDGAARQRMMDAAEQLAVVRAVKESFPGAVIRKVTPRGDLAGDDADTMLFDEPEDQADDERD